MDLGMLVLRNNNKVQHVSIFKVGFYHDCWIQLYYFNETIYIYYKPCLCCSRGEYTHFVTGVCIDSEMSNTDKRVAFQKKSVLHEQWYKFHSTRSLCLIIPNL